MGVTRDCRGGNGELAFNGDRVAVWDDSKYLWMDSGDGFAQQCECT